MVAFGKPTKSPSGFKRWLATTTKKIDTYVTKFCPIFLIGTDDLISMQS